MITFDDGYQDCQDYAIPILRKHGFTATFYLVAGLVGERSVWTERTDGYSRPLLGWAAARELIRQGFHCGAHSLSHRNFDESSPRLRAVTS